jgi:hypothetical protein
MRRTSLLASAAVLLAAACDPTGNVQPAGPTASYRFVNAVADAGGLVVRKDGSVLVSGITFGSVSSRATVSADANILVVSRNSDDFLLGSDTLVATEGRKYTMFGLGTVSNFKSLIATDDTIFAPAGTFKVRFVHGVKDQSAFGLDLYVTATGTDISGVTPQVASLQYGAVSTYFQNDTSARRLRVTPAGTTTLLLDTTFAGTFADSQVVTVVASDKVNGGPPAKFTVVIDRAP